MPDQKALTLEVHNVGPLHRLEAEAVFRPGEVYIVSGDNGVGKTTLWRCLQAAATRQSNLLGLPATRRQDLIHRGRTAGDECKVEVRNDDFGVQWYPESAGNFVCTPEAPVHAGALYTDPACLFAAGEKALTALRLALGYEVQPQDVEAQIKERVDLTMYGGGFAHHAEGLHKLLADEGHAQAMAVIRDRIREAKRQWEAAVAATGESKRWGSLVAKSWKPRGWSSECETSTLEQMEQAADAAADALRAYKEGRPEHLGPCPQCSTHLQLRLADGEPTLEISEAPGEGDAEISDAFALHERARQAQERLALARQFQDAEAARGRVYLWEAVLEVLQGDPMADREWRNRICEVEGKVNAIVGTYFRHLRGEQVESEQVAIHPASALVSVGGTYIGLASRSYQWWVSLALACATLGEWPLLAMDEWEVIAHRESALILLAGLARNSDKSIVLFRAAPASAPKPATHGLGNVSTLRLRQVQGHHTLEEE